MEKIILAIFFLLANTVHAQTFSKSYDYQEFGHQNAPFGLFLTDSGYLVFQRAFGADPEQGQRFVTFHLDSNGNLISEAEFGIDLFHFAHGSRILYDFEAEFPFIVAGGIQDVEAENETKASLFFFDISGTMVNQIVYETDSLHHGWSIYPTTDGHMMLGSSTQLPGSNLGLYISFLDESYEQEWSSYHVDEIDYLYPRQLFLCEDGGWLVTGSDLLTDEFDFCVPNGWDRNMLIVKLDSTGMLEWRQSIGNCAIESGGRTIETSDGNFLIASSRRNTEPEFGDTYLERAAIRKIDCDGDVLWEEFYGDWALTLRLAGVKELQDGSFVAVGWEWIVGDNGPHDHGIVLKVDPNGELLWKRDYQFDPDASCGLNDVSVDEEGNLVCSGYTREAPFNTSMDTWVLKLDAWGCLEPDCHVSIPESSNNRLEIGSSVVTNEILMTISGQDVYSVTLFDINGSQVLEVPHPLDEETLSIPISHLSIGMYVLLARTNNGIYTWKIMKPGH